MGISRTPTHVWESRVLLKDELFLSVWDSCTNAVLVSFSQVSRVELTTTCEHTYPNKLSRTTKLRALTNNNVAFMGILCYLVLQNRNINGPEWWGLEVDDHCPLANCPSIPGTVHEPSYVKSPDTVSFHLSGPEPESSKGSNEVNQHGEALVLEITPTEDVSLVLIGLRASVFNFLVLDAGNNMLQLMEEVSSLVRLRALILNDNEIVSICKA
ncbi:hypothetical protein Tco_1461207 [Tanacetum coccineum]